MSRSEPRSAGRSPDQAVVAQIRPRDRTASRSSASSATLASILPREKSLISRPWTISYAPPAVVHGKEEMRPSGTPYEPSDGTDIETQSPSGVPSTQSRMWSTVALAALAAELDAAGLDDRRAALLHGRQEGRSPASPGRRPARRRSGR